MSGGHSVLRRAGKALHGLMALHATLAHPYLSFMGALLRITPEFPLKKNLINNLLSAPWPRLRFAPRKVQVCDGSAFKLVPHVHEFDFNALVSRQLEYETPVFQALQPRLASLEAVVEIGANVGVYTTFFADGFRSLGKRGLVLAFEPSREAYARLLENLAVNELDGVFTFNVAVSDKTGMVSFYEPRGHLTNGSLDPTFARFFSDEVASTTVLSIDGDQVANLVGNLDPVLLKIDVEGAEETVLRSLAGFICARKPTIVLEVLEVQESALNNLDFLKDNYRLHQITEKGLIERSRFKAGPGRDYLLEPKSDESKR